MIYQVEVENIIFKIFWFIKIKNIILASKSNLPYEINLPRPPHTKVVVFAILFLLIYSVFSGCKKIDSFSRERSPEEIEASFFAAKPGLPLPVLKVMEALKKQNTLGGFIPGLAKRDGYAVWEKSQVNRLNKIPTYNFNGEESDVVEVFTPIVQQDSNFVNGFFFSKIVGDSVELHLYRANDYDLYPFGNTDSTVVTAERITTKLHELNFNIFGPRGLKVRDTSLFSTIKPRDIFDSSIVILKGGYENNPSSFVSYVCWYERSGLCDCGGPCDWNRPCPKMYFTNIRCVAILTNSGGGGAPVGWPPDPPISTGGGGSTPPSTGNCTSTTNCGQLRSLIVEGREPCGGCGPGPIIVVPLEDSPISQYQLDTQWMNDNIKDSSSNP